MATKFLFPLRTGVGCNGFVENVGIWGLTIPGQKWVARGDTPIYTWLKWPLAGEVERCDFADVGCGVSGVGGLGFNRRQIPCTEEERRLLH